MLALTLAALAFGQDAPAEPFKPHFFAGSYGRVQASTDLAGGGGTAFSVVSHAPRLEQGPYLELDLGWEAKLDSGPQFTVLVTPAISGDLFHYDGEWGGSLAMRNLYAQVDNFLPIPLSVWAGSRMYRGDDLYLLNFWPLDNLNTYGGGAMLSPGNTELAVHVGVNRLTGDDWQYQETTVAAPDSVLGEEIVVLDRQRTVTSVRLSQRVSLGESLTLRAKLYGELHVIPTGTRVIEDPFTEEITETLPDDEGTVIGGQLSLWGWAPQSFVHLWVRRSSGLAAYGELAIPTDGLDADYRARDASEWMFALMGNTETQWFGVMAGAYLSYFEDADGQVYDLDDRWELAAVVRPQVYITEHVMVGVEASHQWMRPNGLNPRTGDFDIPQVTKLSLMPAVQVGRGSYTRPRVHLLYTATFLSQDARDWYASDDVRIQDGVQHFMGIGAEWWINSRRVITPF